jgi:hypothetical protein
MTCLLTILAVPLVIRLSDAIEEAMRLRALTREFG